MSAASLVACLSLFAAKAPPPPAAVPQAERTLLGHTGTIFHIAFDATGSHVITASDRESLVWSTSSWHPVKTLPHASTTAAVGGGGATAYVLAHAVLGIDLATGQAKVNLGEDLIPRSFATSADLGRIAVGGMNGKLVVHDVVAARDVLATDAHGAAITALTFNREGTAVASAGEDNGLKVWDVATGKQLANLAAHRAPAEALVLSADGRQLVSGGTEDLIFWDLATAQPLAHFELGVRRLALSPDGTTLAVVGDRGLSLWNMATRERSMAIGGVRFFAVAYSPDGKHLATACDPYASALRIFETSRLSPTYLDGAANLRGHRDAITGMVTLPTGTTLVTGSLDGTVRTWDARGGAVQAVLTPEGGAPVTGLVLGKGAKELYVAHGKRVSVFAVTDGARLGALPDHTAAIVSLDIDRSGKLLLAAAEDNTVRLYKLGKPTALPADAAVVIAVPERLMSAALHPQGKLVAVGGESGTIFLFDTKKGQSKGTLAGHGRAVTALAFNTSGSELLSGSLDQSARLWKLPKGKNPVVMEGLGATVTTVGYHAKTKQPFTATAGGQVRLWDAKGKAPKLAFEGHVDSVGTVKKNIVAMVASRDGKLLYTASHDRSIKVWDGKTGQALMTFTGFLPFGLGDDLTRKGPPALPKRVGPPAR